MNLVEDAMNENHNHKDQGKSRKGRLAIVGTGITAVAHMTLETIGHIQNADVVFYHANSGVSAALIQQLNKNIVDLYEYYGEGKLRSITYIQMAELMLNEVRKGLTVVGVFHGHPGYFVKAGRRAIAIAESEGHEALLLPALSATDCLFADLRIDPGVIGVQILKASAVLSHDTFLATDNHVVLVQVGSVGDNTFSFTGYKHTKLDRFFNRLISIYGEEHDSIYYVAAILPGLDPVAIVRKLGAYRDAAVLDSVNAATLYLPPAGVTVSSLTEIQAFDCKEPYGQFERDAIRELPGHETPNGFKKRYASEPMLRAMTELATSPAAARTFRSNPEAVLAAYPDLSHAEAEALLKRDIRLLRSVTTETTVSQEPRKR
jgi:precorrin-6B methylase 1